MTLARGGRARRFLGSSAVAAGVAFVLVACGAVKQRGELMLAMQTDLELPKDVDTVRIEVTTFGKTLFAQEYPVGPDGVKIPATLGVVGDPNNPATPIEVRVIASQEGTLRVLRNVTTTVPTDRTAILRMPLAWLCWNQVTADSNNAAQSSCPAGQTCIAGECAANAVDSTELKDFDPSEVFGGSNDATSGECLDTVGCFADGVLAAVDPSDCSIPKPASSGAGINVAMIRKPGVPGICSAEACYVPLDEDQAEGWSDAGDKILLPKAVCDRLFSPSSPNLSIVGVVVTTTCATKTPSTPTCGPWSSVGGGEGTFDAGTPVGFDAGPRTDFVGTWTANGLVSAESCTSGEPYTTSLTIAQGANGQYVIGETDAPVLTVDGTCQSVAQTGIPGTLNADGTLTFTPSLASTCGCKGSSLNVTLSITPNGVLNASQSYSGIDQCPTTGGSTGTGDAPDASSFGPDATVSADGGLVGQGVIGQGTGTDAGVAGTGGICSTCSNDLSCTVDVSFVRIGSGGTGGSTADSGAPFTDASTQDDGGAIGPPPPTCSPVNCSGCCATDGTCQSGFLGTACGVNGEACTNCAPLGGTCGATGQCVKGGGVDASAPTDSGTAPTDAGVKGIDGG